MARTKQGVMSGIDFSGESLSDKKERKLPAKRLKKPVQESVKGTTFSEKEIDFLHFIVEYFHSYHYGADRLGTFRDLKKIVDGKFTGKDSVFMDEFNRLEMTETEYYEFWEKLV